VILSFWGRKEKGKNRMENLGDKRVKVFVKAMAD
jgi:hypothetical protein